MESTNDDSDGPWYHIVVEISIFLSDYLCHLLLASLSLLPLYQSHNLLNGDWGSKGASRRASVWQGPVGERMAKGFPATNP